MDHDELKYIKSMSSLDKMKYKIIFGLLKL